MTQGTKIGLLVSLAFLIVICVLLSDHVVSTSDAKPAIVASAAYQVAQGISTPGIVQSPVTAEPAPVEVAIAPSAQLQTAQEMGARQAPPPAIAIGPGPRSQVEIRAANANVPTNVRIAPPVEIGPGASVRVLGDPPRTDDAVLRENFVTPRTLTAETTSTTPPVVANAQAPAAAPKSIEYVAKSGDTVSKMARKHYGLDTKANRDLIINANKSLKSDPNKIEVGKTYAIPVKPGTVLAAAVMTRTTPPAGTELPVVSVGPANTATGSATPTALSTATTPVAPTPAAGSATAERTYVVKAGDNLWKIATEQCKDPRAVAQIKKLNRDILKNSTDLKVGTKLRLPAPTTP